MEKIVRTICYFSADPDEKTVARINAIAEALSGRGYEIQTRRICSTGLGLI